MPRISRPGWKDNPRDETELREMVVERVKQSGSKNQGFMRVLRKLWRYYLSASPRSQSLYRDNSRDPGAGVDWRADLFVPESFSVVETAVPRSVFALFGSRPYVTVQGRERFDEEKARMVESLLDYDFEQAKLLLKAIEFFKSFYVFGTAICRVDYYRDFYELEGSPYWDIDIDYDAEGNVTDARPVQRTEKKVVVRFDGPRIHNVNIMDFYPDPMFNEIDDMRYVAEREETTKRRIEKDNERYKALTGKNLYRNLDKIKPMRDAGRGDLGNSEDMRADTADVFRFEYGYGRRDKMRGDLDEDMVILHHYWEDDRYVVLANGHHILRDGPNPYRDKRKPYVAAQCFPTINEFYGQGLLAPIQSLQEELNTLRNIALDQGKLNLYGVWAVDSSLGLTDTDLVLHPGKIVETEFSASGKPLAQQIFNTSLPSDYERLEGRVRADIQTTLAINDYVSGAGTGSASTASEAQMLQAGAQNRFRLQALVAQEKFLVGVSQKFLSRRQQFLDKKRVFRVLGASGVDYPEIGPEEIAGEFDFMPLGSQSHPNKEVTRQQLLSLVPVLTQNPILLQRTNWEEVHKEIFNSFDFRQPQRFIVDDPLDQMPQEQENYILSMGEQVRVKPSDNHQDHYQKTLLGLEQALAQGADERVQQAFQDHADEHAKYLKMLSAQAGGGPGGLPSGPPSGSPGNQPTNPQQMTPNMPSMQASVMGGPGGIIGG